MRRRRLPPGAAQNLAVKPLDILGHREVVAKKAPTKLPGRKGSITM